MFFRNIVLLFLLLSSLELVSAKDTLLGAYYFGGWSGHRKEKEEWAIGMPTHVTKKLKNDFSDREPIWGWRDDDLSIMEKQIDLAADNGIDFFMFCWYGYSNNGAIDTTAINTSSLHHSIQLFLKSKNRNRIKFAILIANHEGYRITNSSDWQETIGYLKEHYFDDSQYLYIDGAPVISFFDGQGAHPFLPDMQSYALRCGLNGLFTISLGTFYHDSQINSWYNIITPASDSIKEYSALVNYVEHFWPYQKNSYNVVPLVMTGWDPRPWYSNPVFYSNRNAAVFEKHLKHAFESLDKSNPSYRMILIFAWNELGEGGYLVPTKGDPKSSFLRRIRKVRKKLKQ